MTMTTRQIITAQHDIFRLCLGNGAMWGRYRLQGQVYISPGIERLDLIPYLAAFHGVVAYQFTRNNDPFATRSHGSWTTNGNAYRWAIDLQEIVPSWSRPPLSSPVDPRGMWRVLSIALADESFPAWGDYYDPERPANNLKGGMKNPRHYPIAKVPSLTGRHPQKT